MPADYYWNVDQGTIDPEGAPTSFDGTNHKGYIERVYEEISNPFTIRTGIQKNFMLLDFNIDLFYCKAGKKNVLFFQNYFINPDNSADTEYWKGKCPISSFFPTNMYFISLSDTLNLELVDNLYSSTLENNLFFKKVLYNFNQLDPKNSRSRIMKKRVGHFLPEVRLEEAIKDAIPEILEGIIQGDNKFSFRFSDVNSIRFNYSLNSLDINFIKNSFSSSDTFVNPNTETKIKLLLMFMSSMGKSVYRAFNDGHNPDSLNEIFCCFRESNYRYILFLKDGVGNINFISHKDSNELNISEVF